MKTVSREFKGVWIPREIWLSEELTLQEKVFIVEVDSLTHNSKGYCYASNAYFASFFKVAKNRISKIVSNLHKKGILDVWDITEGKQIVERRMKINSGWGVLTKSDEGYLENDNRVLTKSDEGYSQKGEGSNTYITIQKRNTVSNKLDTEPSSAKMVHKKIVKKKKILSEEELIEQSTDNILEHWKTCNGKVHRSDLAKGMIEIKNMIYALLIDGRNPYISVCDDHNLKFKKWTEDEIIKSIDYYTKTLFKDISKTYFDEFIIVRYRSQKYKNSAPDKSHLVECFTKIKESILDEPSEKLKKKLTPAINGTPVSPKIFTRASKYLTYIDEKYKVSDGACVTLNRNILNVFVRYVEEKKNNLEWKISYIAGDTFKDEFIETMLKRNVIMKKKAKRIDGKVVYY